MRLGHDPSVRRLTENDGEFSINSEKEKKQKKQVRSRRRKGREEEEGKKKHEGDCKYLDGLRAP